MYKSGKNWVAAAVVAAAAAVAPMISTESAYANEEVAQTTSSWRAKTVDQVVEAVQAAGQKYTVQAEIRCQRSHLLLNLRLKKSLQLTTFQTLTLSLLVKKST